MNSRVFIKRLKKYRPSIRLFLDVQSDVKTGIAIDKLNTDMKISKSSLQLMVSSYLCFWLCMCRSSSHSSSTEHT